MGLWMKKNYIIKICLVVLIVVIDLITKELLFGVDLTIIPHILSSRSTHGYLNTGGAWGILGDNMWLLILITLLFLGLVVFIEIKWKNSNALYSVSLSFIVGGAVGNFIDRIFLGGVRDFLYFEFYPSFPTFNVADSFLCVGVFLMLIFIFFVSNKEKDSLKVNKINNANSSQRESDNTDIQKICSDRNISQDLGNNNSEKVDFDKNSQDSVRGISSDSTSRVVGVKNNKERSINKNSQDINSNSVRTSVGSVSCTSQDINSNSEKVRADSVSSTSQDMDRNSEQASVDIGFSTCQDINSNSKRARVDSGKGISQDISSSEQVSIDSVFSTSQDISSSGRASVDNIEFSKDSINVSSQDISNVTDSNQDSLNASSSVKKSVEKSSRETIDVNDIKDNKNMGFEKSSKKAGRSKSVNKNERIMLSNGSQVNTKENKDDEI